MVAKTSPAPKAAAKLEAPQPGKCRRVINGKRHMAPVPTDHSNWTWCRACVDEHNAAKRKAAPKAKATPTKMPASKSKTPAAAVAAAAAKADSVDPMERELAAVKAMKDATAKA